jgi:hypothetical protein
MEKREAKHRLAAKIDEALSLLEELKALKGVREADEIAELQADATQGMRLRHVLGEPVSLPEILGGLLESSEVLEEARPQGVEVRGLERVGNGLGHCGLGLQEGAEARRKEAQAAPGVADMGKGRSPEMGEEILSEDRAKGELVDDGEGELGQFESQGGIGWSLVAREAGEPDGQSGRAIAALLEGEEALGRGESRELQPESSRRRLGDRKRQAGLFLVLESMRRIEEPVHAMRAPAEEVDHKSLRLLGGELALKKVVELGVRRMIHGWRGSGLGRGQRGAEAPWKGGAILKGAATKGPASGLRLGPVVGSEADPAESL